MRMRRGHDDVELVVAGIAPAENLLTELRAPEGLVRDNQAMAHRAPPGSLSRPYSRQA
jgi:hypothetical protein